MAVCHFRQLLDVVELVLLHELGEGFVRHGLVQVFVSRVEQPEVDEPVFVRVESEPYLVAGLQGVLLLRLEVHPVEEGAVQRRLVDDEGSVSVVELDDRVELRYALVLESYSRVLR